jgi:murein DD-endopeptidase MepM/ murein hydrolase activator NlpD
MSFIVELVRSRPLLRAIALTAIAASAAACSSESSRLTNNTNPYAAQPNQREVTGSVQQRAPAAKVQTSALPPPNGVQPATVPPGSGVSGGGRGMASYQPGQTPDPVVTGAVQRPHAAQVPPPAPQRQVAAPPRQTPPPRQAMPSAGVHLVAPGDTLSRIARQYNTTLIELGRLNNIPPHAKLNVGDQIRVPGRVSSNINPKILPPAKSLNAPKTRMVAKNDPKGKSEQPSETISVSTPTAEPPVTTSSVRSSSGKLAFRWPAKGRVIAGFGPKTNGQTNDGINIALPEGTAVKAAQDGVVAYAGNELKGYGNLVLVRHSEGYVTAYAHAKELMVKRGDQIKRGQTIAKSGQTGNVDAPQLHFEIRKGPAPIDPMPMLSGGD